MEPTYKWNNFQYTMLVDWKFYWKNKKVPLLYNGNPFAVPVLIFFESSFSAVTTRQYTQHHFAIQSVVTVVGWDRLTSLSIRLRVKVGNLSPLGASECITIKIKHKLSRLQEPIGLSQNRFVRQRGWVAKSHLTEKHTTKGQRSNLNNDILSI